MYCRIKKEMMVNSTQIKWCNSETGMTFHAAGGESESWIKADLVLDKGIRTDQLEKEIKKLLKL
jgi:hypothetical protein